MNTRTPVRYCWYLFVSRTVRVETLQSSHARATRCQLFFCISRQRVVVRARGTLYCGMVVDQFGTNPFEACEPRNEVLMQQETIYLGYHGAGSPSKVLHKVFGTKQTMPNNSNLQHHLTPRETFGHTRFRKLNYKIC